MKGNQRQSSRRHSVKYVLLEISHISQENTCALNISVFQVNQELVFNENLKIGINVYLGFPTERKTSV